MNTKKYIPIAAIITTLSVFIGLLIYMTQKSVDDLAPYAYPKISEPDYEKALQIMKKRVVLFPDSVIEANGLAGLYIQLAHETGEHKLILEAEKLAKKSLQLRTYQNTAAELLLAEVAESRHSFHESLKTAKDVLKREPQNLGPYGILVTSNLGLGRNEEALIAATVLVSRKPSLGNYILLGLVHEALGNISQSRVYYKKGLSLEDIAESGSSAWARTLLGRSYLDAGETTKARNYLNTALKISPKYHLALSLLAKVEVMEKNYAAAERFYTEAYQHSGEPPYLIEHAKLKKLVGDMKSAQEKLATAESIVRKELIETPFGHPAELIEILLERAEKKDVEEAVFLAKKEVKARENYRKAQHNLARALDLRNSL